jgi:hypothetical protein
MMCERDGPMCFQTKYTFSAKRKHTSLSHAMTVKHNNSVGIEKLKNKSLPRSKADGNN